jgi:hypothetical protein
VSDGAEAQGASGGQAAAASCLSLAWEELFFFWPLPLPPAAACWQIGGGAGAEASGAASKHGG